MTQPHVVIIGGGFAGLEAAQHIAKAHRDARITVLDRRNHHLFQPLLYQVATAGLSPADISMPIRTALRSYPNVEVRLCEVTDADLNARRLETSLGPIEYDFVIFAAGATHSYFGNDQWEEYAPGLKTLEQATEIRRRVLRAFELAEFETDPKQVEKLLTFVVGGRVPRESSWPAPSVRSAGSRSLATSDGSTRLRPPSFWSRRGPGSCRRSRKSSPWKRRTISNGSGSPFAPIPW